MGPIKPLSTDKSNSLLNVIKKSLDLRGKTQTLKDEEERVRQFILNHFPKSGRAPIQSEIEKGTSIKSEEIDRVLEKLDRVDIIYLKEGVIEGAYPFSNSPTDFQLTFPDGQEAFAMCAIDALGIPFMFDSDLKIDSACAYCGEDTEITVENGGITETKPVEIRVFAGLECGEHAATTLCTTLVFLCKEHIQDFEEIQEGENEVLTLGEALYVGKGIFGSL